MPKRHVATFTDLTDDELSEIKAQILGLYDAFNRAGKAADYNLLSNNGEAADQHILHVHIHVFMRSQNDVSPFDILSRKSDRETQSETEWTAQVTKLCALLSAK